MTTINAIRFDDVSGAMISDEERSWNPEDMKIHSAEKIRPIIPKEIQRRYGIVAAYGNTGTSTIGDEIKARIVDRIRNEYRTRVASGRLVGGYLSMAEISRIVFEVIIGVKKSHIDQELLGKYGFMTRDYIRGVYSRDGKEREISDKSIREAAEALITWKDKNPDARSVFANAGIIAGYSPKDGFQMYHITQSEQYIEPVGDIFISDGAGVDAATLVFSDYASTKDIRQRRGHIDPAEAMLAAICAVNSASRHNLCVGGYYNIIIFNGHARRNIDKMKLFNDHRVKLASEIVWANMERFISTDTAISLLRDIFFKESTYQEVASRFLRCVRQPVALSRLLRGYKTRK